MKKDTVEGAEERKARMKKMFPSHKELKIKASNTQVDNDKTWKHVDKDTAEKQNFIDTVRTIGKWNVMPAIVLQEQLEKVFPIKSGEI